MLSLGAHHGKEACPHRVVVARVTLHKTALTTTPGMLLDRCTVEAFMSPFHLLKVRSHISWHVVVVARATAATYRWAPLHAVMVL